MIRWYDPLACCLWAGWIWTNLMFMISPYATYGVGFVAGYFVYLGFSTWTERYCEWRLYLES
jgi:hypothetical protein